MMRSLLFVPANDAKRIARVHERGADAIVLDLEDGVSLEAKVEARAGVAAAATRITAHGATVFVRVNADWRDDLASVLIPEVSGIVAPKIADAASAEAVAAAIKDKAEARSVALIALIESAAGLFNAPAIAAVEGVSALALGGEDLCAELGVPPSQEALDLPCKLIALAAASRGLAALGAPASIGDFRELDGYREAVGRARAIGMSGTLCIHPAQVAIANAGFAPSAAEIAQARDIVEAWEKRGARGVIAVNGQMIDAPVVARARRVLASTGS